MLVVHENQSGSSPPTCLVYSYPLDLKELKICRALKYIANTGQANKYREMLLAPMNQQNLFDGCGENVYKKKFLEKKKPLTLNSQLTCGCKGVSSRVRRYSDGAATWRIDVELHNARREGAKNNGGKRQA